jgi:hypothetical protein
MSGTPEKQQLCREIIVGAGGCALVLRGIRKHERMENLVRTRLFLNCLMRLGISNSLVLENVFRILEFTYDRDSGIVRDVLNFWRLHSDYSDATMMHLALCTNFVSVVTKIMTLYVNDWEIFSVSGFLIGQFVQVGPDMLAVVMNAGVAGEILRVLLQDVDQTRFEILYYLLTIIAKDAQYASHFDDAGVFKFIIRKTLASDLRQTNVHISLYVLTTLVSFWTNHTGNLRRKILGYGAMELVNTSLIRYCSDKVCVGKCFELILLFLRSEHADSVVFCDRVVYRLSISIHVFIDNLELLMPLLVILTEAVLKRNSEHWIIVYNTSMAAIFAAMDAHRANVDFQHVALDLLESVFLHTETVGSIFNLKFISSILFSLRTHTQTAFCLKGIEILVQNMCCAQYKKHMVDDGAIVVALMLLKNTTNSQVARKTMSFLSCFEAEDLNSQISGKFIQSLTRRQKKIVGSHLKDTKEIVQNACTRFPQTCLKSKRKMEKNAEIIKGWTSNT